MAVALLGNTIATGAMLYVLITILGPISGAHFNPAVTLALWLEKRVSHQKAIAFVIIQAIAGIAGTLAAHAMFDEPILQWSENYALGQANGFQNGLQR